MADSAAVLLFLAAIGAVVFRVVVATSAMAATPPGDPKPPVWYRQNKFVVCDVLMAFAVAVLLLTSPIGGWAGVIPFLLSLVAVAVLICMAVPWPENNIGDWFFNNTWGQPVYETDPAVDDRLDPMSMYYDPAMDSHDAAYDEDYFKSNAIVKERETPYGLFAFFGAAAAIAVYVLVAWLVIGLSGISFGSIGGAPSGSQSTPTVAAPAVTPTEAAPSSAAPSSSAPSGKSKTTKPAPSSSDSAKESPDLSGATCDELKGWLPKRNESQRESFYTGGIFRCTGAKSWTLWTGEAPGFIEVTANYKTNLYNYYVFNWNGEDVLIREQVNKK